MTGEGNAGVELLERWEILKQPYRFEGQAFTHETVWYRGPDCQEKNQNLSYAYRAVALEAGEQPAAGWQVYTFEYESIQATAWTALRARKFSQDSIFGYADWEAQQAKEIAGRAYSSEDRPFPSAHKVRECTLKFEGNALYQARYKNDVADLEDAQRFTKAQ